MKHTTKAGQVIKDELVKKMEDTVASIRTRRFVIKNDAALITKYKKRYDTLQEMKFQFSKKKPAKNFVEVFELAEMNIRDIRILLLTLRDNFNANVKLQTQEKRKIPMYKALIDIMNEELS